METETALIASIEIRPIREVFKHEAFDFTKWLEEHIDDLGSRLKLDLTVVQREKKVGDFIVDLQCEEKGGKQVIVENQLGRSDHSHLGQLLTYLVNLEASTAIWVTPEPRVEHEKVIEWLNEATPVDIAFYLVKVEAVRIAGSPYAPLFTIVSGPDHQVKEIGKDKKEWADRHYQRYEFWTGLLEKSKKKTKLFANKTPSKDHWLTVSSGINGISLSYLIHLNDGGLELYIDFGPDSDVKNKAFFDELFKYKDTIESDYGKSLQWLRLNEKRACRVISLFEHGGLSQPATWDALQDKMIDGMIRFDQVLLPILKKIKV